MADRKQFLNVVPIEESLALLLSSTRRISVTEEVLREQRISFAFGNALNSKDITKESVRYASENIRLKA